MNKRERYVATLKEIERCIETIRLTKSKEYLSSRFDVALGVTNAMFNLGLISSEELKTYHSLLIKLFYEMKDELVAYDEDEEEED